MTPAQEARMERRVSASVDAALSSLWLEQEIGHDEVIDAAYRAYQAGYSDGRQDGAATGGEA